MTTEIKLRPLGARALVKKDKAEEMVGKIMLPRNADRRPVNIGTVIAVGEGEFNQKTGERVPMPVKVGERIIIDDYAGSQVKTGLEADEDLVIVTEKNILAVVEEA